MQRLQYPYAAYNLSKMHGSIPTRIGELIPKVQILTIRNQNQPANPCQIKLADT